MTDVILATSSSVPDGEQEGHRLVTALDARGVTARWAVWDDAGVAWDAALVAVRSTWDYEARRQEFLSWARSLPRVLNSAATFAWNTDKAYLCDLLEAGVPVVPSLLADDPPSLREAVGSVGGPAVVKPRVAAGGRGVVLVGAVDRLEGVDLGTGPWVVQPLVPSIRTEGERAVFVLGGEVAAQARKTPGGSEREEIRVHPQYGGRTVAEPVEPESADLARVAIAVAEQVLGDVLDYARVDLMRLDDGRLVVSELELTEPGLYLPVLPTNAETFADVVVAHLARR
ncbi:ATP-grasp domain-containing protein [Nocardioides marmoraquaticus]